MSKENRTLQIGDHVADKGKKNDETDDVAMLVVSRHATRADNFTIDESGTTVADVNADYPDDDKVIEVVFPQEHALDVSNLNRYAYPVSRLELLDPVHGKREWAEEDSARVQIYTQGNVDVEVTNVDE